MKWEETFLGKCFISDLGEDQVLENKNKKKLCSVDTLLGLRYREEKVIRSLKSAMILKRFRRNTTFLRTEFVFLLESGGYI